MAQYLQIVDDYVAIQRFREGVSVFLIDNNGNEHLATNENMIKIHFAMNGLVGTE